MKRIINFTKKYFYPSVTDIVKRNGLNEKISYHTQRCLRLIRVNALGKGMDSFPKRQDMGKF